MKSAQSSPIVVVGSVNFDVTYNMLELPLAGETVLASGRRDAPGVREPIRPSRLQVTVYPCRSCSALETITKVANS